MKPFVGVTFTNMHSLEVKAVTGGLAIAQSVVPWGELEDFVNYLLSHKPDSQRQRKSPVAKDAVLVVTKVLRKTHRSPNLTAAIEMLDQQALGGKQITREALEKKFASKLGLEPSQAQTLTSDLIHKYRYLCPVEEKP